MNSLRWWLALLPCLLAHGALAAPQLLDQQVGESFRLSGTMTVPPAALERGEVKLLFGWTGADDHLGVSIGREQAQFFRTVGGRSEPLGIAGTIYRGNAGDQLRFSLQRRGWQLALSINHVLIATAEYGGLTEGQVGFETAGAGLAVGELELQPTDEIWLSDDFMRVDRALGGWEALTGEWRNNQQGSKVSRSANAFSFLSDGAKESLAVIGYPFWSEYVAQAAVRSDGTGAVGLAVGVVDAEHYYRLRWTSRRHADGGTMRLQRVFAGQVTDLTPPMPGGFEAGVWYKLQLALAAGRVYGWIDERPLFEVTVLGTGEGRVGLWTEPGAGDNPRTRGALFDDVVVRSYPLFCDDFTRPSTGRWQIDGGWQVGSGADGAAVARGSGRMLGGDASWGDSTAGADVKLSRGSLGVAICATDEGAGYELRLGAQSAELVKHGAAHEVLDSTDHGLPADTWARVGLSRDRGLIRATLDGEPLLEAFDLDLPGGGIALLADGAQGAVDNVQVSFRPALWRAPPTLPAEFENDQYMTDWAGPGSAWVQVEGSPVRWHKGFFYGDRQIRFQVPGIGQQEGVVTLVMGAADTADEQAYRLSVQLSRDEPRLTFALTRGNQVLAREPLAGAGDEAEVLFELRGRFILVWVDGKCLIEHSLREG